jgi:SAM-dependent methyltransferase
MLPENLARLLARPSEERVLDVGGWAAPVNRADWVIDLMPYESRGVLMPGGFGPAPERFDAGRWVVADICSHEPWPFADGYFDFAVCTFTLEDVRDPIRVCQEMSRVARAGYVEVPSLLDELSWRNPEASGGPWAGHSHHRWLCTLQDGELTFLQKAHSLHTRRSVRVPPRWARRLTDRERVLAHFWKGELPARERPAIDDYPFAELERAVRERFRPSGPELAAMAVRERVQASARHRLDRAAARARAALRRVRDDQSTGEQ